MESFGWTKILYSSVDSCKKNLETKLNFIKTNLHLYRIELFLEVSLLYCVLDLLYWRMKYQYSTQFCTSDPHFIEHYQSCFYVFNRNSVINHGVNTISKYNGRTEQWVFKKCKYSIWKLFERLQQGHNTFYVEFFRSNVEYFFDVSVCVHINIDFLGLAFRSTIFNQRGSLTNFWQSDCLQRIPVAHASWNMVCGFSNGIWNIKLSAE